VWARLHRETGITRGELLGLRSLQRPGRAILDIVAAATLLLHPWPLPGVDRPFSSVVDGNAAAEGMAQVTEQSDAMLLPLPRSPALTEWRLLRRLFADEAAFARQLLRFVSEGNVTEAKAVLLEPLLVTDTFKPDAVGKVSKGAARLCGWVLLVSAARVAKLCRDARERARRRKLRARQAELAARKGRSVRGTPLAGGGSRGRDYRSVFDRIDPVTGVSCDNVWWVAAPFIRWSRALLGAASGIHSCVDALYFACRGKMEL